MKVRVHHEAVAASRHLLRPAGTDHGATPPGTHGQLDAPGFVAYRGVVQPFADEAATPSADQWPAWVSGVVLLSVWGGLALAVYVVGWGWAW